MNKFFHNILSAACLFFLCLPLHAQRNKATTANRQPEILPAASRTEQYLPLLKGKSVAIFANQTSTVGNTHLIDTLLSRGVKVKKVFSPEHGFRGTADAGEKVGNALDKKTGVELISLYGLKRKPTAEDLKDVDIMMFDIQDVGVRFYTYISSLQEFIESAVEHDKPLIILDRPNPNGFYVDGPVLDKKFRSFVGMQPIPIVYGMTIGEYAQMLIGEKWVDTSRQNSSGLVTTVSQKTSEPKKFSLKIVPCSNYTHKSLYELPVKPSPNLPEIQSIYWYPSTCFFEGTVLSEGRGTDKPFQIFGHPSLPKNLYRFVPTNREGATNPKLKDQVCYGWNISGDPQDVLHQVNKRIQLKWLINAYRLFPAKEKFFLSNNFFNRLAGNDILMKQIRDGKSESEIRRSWQNDLTQFKKIRKKYLLYPDFE